MTENPVLLLLLIESCHQVVTQLLDRVKAVWHMRIGFAVSRGFSFLERFCSFLNFYSAYHSTRAISLSKLENCAAEQTIFVFSSIGLELACNRG